MVAAVGKTPAVVRYGDLLYSACEGVNGDFEGRTIGFQDAVTDYGGARRHPDYPLAVIPRRHDSGYGGAMVIEVVGFLALRKVVVAEIGVPVLTQVLVDRFHGLIDDGYVYSLSLGGLPYVAQVDVIPRRSLVVLVVMEMPLASRAGDRLSPG